MPYSYEDQKAWVLSDPGQRVLIRAHDAARTILQAAGAVLGHKITSARAVGPSVWDNWQMMALLERMVEIGDLTVVVQSTNGSMDCIYVAGPGLR